ncbi:hypothetical protein SDC9_114158 [bioreactor metagenome]|uniref:Uncharacterized protein n=1 Tax=bioreactor metagenome TaxID=1076179 RepID=A0A645BPQ9_9ZZZZ
MVGCFKPFYVSVVTAGCRRCIVSNITVFVQPNRDVCPCDSGKRHALRFHPAEGCKKDFVLIVRKPEVCVQFAARSVFAGEEDHLVFTGLQRDIRQRPFVQVFRIVREEITQQRHRFAGKILEFHPFGAVAVRVNRRKCVVFEHLVDVHGIAWFHHTHREGCERHVAVCRFKGRVCGIHSRAGSVLDHRNAADNPHFPAHAVDQVSL